MTACQNSAREQVLNWLASQGFDRSLMSATGRGERELKEPTIDNVSNAANPARRSDCPLGLAQIAHRHHRQVVGRSVPPRISRT